MTIDPPTSGRADVAAEPRSHMATKRREDPRLLKGEARFVDDLSLDGMLEGVFIRSPHAHARIRSIDARNALSAGARLVLTAADLPFNDRPWVVRYWHESIRGGMPTFLATDRVRFVGDPVAFLVAESRYLAEDLAALVEIDYELLPSIASIADATAPSAPQLHPGWTGNIAATFHQAKGNATAAMVMAPHRLRRRYCFARQTPVALETRGIIADYDTHNEFLTAFMSTQAHYNVRQNLATILDIPEYQVRVVAEDVGGGFGAKSRTYAEEIVVSHASRCLGLPVKWIEDRRENLVATTHSRAIEVDLELGCDETGRFLALDAEVCLDLGGYVFTSGVMTAEIAGAHLTNTYDIQATSVTVRCIGTNKTPIATYRGAGQPEACFPIESIVELIAKSIGMSAAAIRKRNILTADHIPYDIGRRLAGSEMIVDAGDFAGVLDSLIAASGYEEQVETTSSGCRIAWGMATAIEGSGFVNFETSDLRIDTSGNVTVLSGMTSQGQGQLTTYAMVASEALGVAIERVRVRLGDTGLVPFGRGSFASRGAIFGANSVHVAASLLKQRILQHAAVLLQADAATLDINGGRVIRRDGTDTGLGIGDIARAVLPGGPLFSGDAALGVQHVYKADRLITYGGSAHAVRVSLDPRTGAFKLLDYVIAHDAGRALNHMIVNGQVIGGAVDGMGGALFSEIAYSPDGQPLSTTLADYLLATATEVPRIRLVEMETRPPSNPLGVRGIGEGGLIPVGAAIANALARAIDPTGIGHETELSQLPLTTQRVFRACQQVGL